MFRFRSHARMSTKHFESLTQLIRAEVRLRVECECNRVAILDPDQLLDQVMKRRGSHQLAKVVAQMRCSRCGARPWRWGPA